VESEPNDREARLAARLAAGELDALGQVYDAHHQHVRAFAQRLLGDESAAEDLVQDTFVALPRLVGKFRGSASLRTFLISVAVNKARHHLRSAVRRRLAHERSLSDERSCVSTPEDLTEREETLAALLRAMDTLPVEQRVALVLCEVEERSSADAAQIVGVPEGTVRTRIFHGKRKLREALLREGFR
jgi:RNA polymerase sigma-70 factor (ECF subfamily)